MVPSANLGTGRLIPGGDCHRPASSDLSVLRNRFSHPGPGHQADQGPSQPPPIHQPKPFGHIPTTKSRRKQIKFEKSALAIRRSTWFWGAPAGRTGARLPRRERATQCEPPQADRRAGGHQYLPARSARINSLSNANRNSRCPGWGARHNRPLPEPAGRARGRHTKRSPA